MDKIDKLCRDRKIDLGQEGYIDTTSMRMPHKQASKQPHTHKHTKQI